MSEAYVILSLVRFLVALTIFKWPLFGVLASIYVDINDFNFLNIQTPSQMEAYQVWDKIFDSCYLSFAALTSLRWKDQLAKKISVVSFLYRFLGVLTFPLVGIRSLLFFFPNFFENFFLFYLIFTKFVKGKKLLDFRFDTFVIIVAILIPSLAREYFMHVIKTPPWDAYDLSRIMGISRMQLGIDISYWGWIAILLFLPLVTLGWKIIKAK